MPSCSVKRIALSVVAALLIVAAGGAAVAGPSGEEHTLAPTASLSSSGGASAPAPATGGGVSAPDTETPSPEPVVSPAPSPTEAPATGTAPAPAPAPTAPETPVPAPETAPPPTEPVEPVETPTDPELAPEEPPDTAGAMGAAGTPLVPAEVLPMETTGAPLIDISPAHVAAEPLRSQVELADARPAQDEGEDNVPGEQDEGKEDDGEVIIPVPVDGDDDTGDAQLTPTAPSPTAGERGPRLPSTGRDLAGPAGTALLLLLAGAALRLAAAPSAAARART